MTSLFDLNQPVVLDLGSGLTKAGFAGSAEPTALLGTLVGHAKHPQVIPLSTASTPPAASIANATSTSPLSPNTRPKFTAEPLTPRRIVVGNALQTLSGVVRLSHPLHRGTVQSWPDAEEVWRHVLYDVLALGHGEHPMLVTENALVPRANRDRLAEFFFESAQVPSLCVAVPAVLALYASGRTTGLVLDVGDTLATALPVAEGHCDMHAIRRLDIGGRDVTDRLVTLLRKSGYALFASSSERQAARRIKERLGYIAVNPRDEEHRFAADAPELNRFDLPDGNVVSVGAESFRAPEILFRPEIMSREFGGVHDCVKAAIDSVDLELKQRLYGSVLLAVSCPSRSSSLMRNEDDNMGNMLCCGFHNSTDPVLYCWYD